MFVWFVSDLIFVLLRGWWGKYVFSDKKYLKIEKVGVLCRLWDRFINDGE